MGAVRMSRLAIPHMKQRGGGRIVNVTTVGGKAPAARGVPTSVTRAAGINLTKSLANEYAGSNIRVNTICIGLVRSAQMARRAKGDLEEHYSELAKRVPLGRVAHAAEFADLFAFLVSERATYITGASINFDGGTVIQPEFTALLLGLVLHQAGTGHDHGVDARRDPAALCDLRDRAQILDAAVGAGADEDAIDLDLAQRRARLQAHILERALHGAALGLIARGGRIGHGAGDRQHVLRAGSPGDLRRDLGRIARGAPAHATTSSTARRRAAGGRE